jgi:hypothetical protein
MISLEEEKFDFGSWFQRFQSRSLEEHHGGGSTQQNKLLTSWWPGSKDRDKEGPTPFKGAPPKRGHTPKT